MGLPPYFCIVRFTRCQKRAVMHFCFERGFDFAAFGGSRTEEKIFTLFSILFGLSQNVCSRTSVYSHTPYTMMMTRLMLWNGKAEIDCRMKERGTFSFTLCPYFVIRENREQTVWRAGGERKGGRRECQGASSLSLYLSLSLFLSGYFFFFYSLSGSFSFLLSLGLFPRSFNARHSFRVASRQNKNSCSYKPISSLNLDKLLR